MGTVSHCCYMAQLLSGGCVFCLTRVFKIGIAFWGGMGYNGGNVMEVYEMKLRKFLVSSLVGAMLVQQLGFVSSANRFTDVNTSDWYYEAVEFVASQGLMTGTGVGVFSPYVSTTRAMFVAMLYPLAGSPTPESLTHYTDVSVSDWYCNAVCWAREMGVASGRGDGIFNPHVELTREQLVVMLYGYEKQKYGQPSSVNIELSFTDLDELSLWSVSATKWAVASGLVSGRNDGRFDPHASASRGEVAQILQNYVALRG